LEWFSFRNEMGENHSILMYDFLYKMKNTFLTFTLLFSILSFGQANIGFALMDKKMAAIPQNSTISTDAIANYINSNFKTENDKIRAVFYWTASNISYDVKNMFAVNLNQTTQEKIVNTLKTKKGVCIHYAEVFNEISNKVGIKSYIIEGYTKQNGKIAALSHAWCAAKIDSKWYLFDPTWGSGSINNGVFVKKINDYYFKTEPSKIISSHMPFDYLWQFLNYPITNQEFYNGKTQTDKTKKQFDFESEILKYEKLSEMDKLIGSAERIEKNGVKNVMIFDRLSHKKSEIEYYKQIKENDDFNHIVNLYNEGIRELNEYINFRNKQFKPNVPDEELKRMIDDPKSKLLDSLELLNNLGKVDKGNLSNVNSIRKGLMETIRQVEEHESFVREYLSKSKISRKSMFTKVSWFGIPLN